MSITAGHRHGGDACDRAMGTARWHDSTQGPCSLAGQRQKSPLPRRFELGMWAARAQITSSVRAAAACRQRHPSVQAVLRPCRHHGSATPGDHIGGYRPHPAARSSPADASAQRLRQCGCVSDAIDCSQNDSSGRSRCLSHIRGTLPAARVPPAGGRSACDAVAARRPGEHTADGQRLRCPAGSQ
jgi:hypothetical protein